MSDRVVDAYNRRAQEYSDLLGSIELTTPEDRHRILTWAKQCDGPVLDLGCGPGHWTAWLKSHGVDVAGTDPSAAFIKHARQHHPEVSFFSEDLDSIARNDSHRWKYHGVLAWYSLIHTEPDHLGAALVTVAELLRPGGQLLLGFFDGASEETSIQTSVDCAHPVRFDHAVTEAWYWPVGWLRSCAEDAGFEFDGAIQRTDPGVRPHADAVCRLSVITAS